MSTTSPSTGTTTLPAVPSTTPGWLLKVVSLLLLVVGIALPIVDPKHLLTTTLAKALVILGFLFVAFAIFTIHIGIEALHKYGWTKSAAAFAWSQEEQEFKQLWPEFKQNLPAVQQLIDTNAQLKSDLTAVQNDVAEVKNKIASLPAADQQAIQAVLSNLLSGASKNVPEPVPPTPAPAPAANVVPPATVPPAGTVAPPAQ